MKNKNEWIRVDSNFKKLLRESKLKRIANGVDKKMRSDREMTKLIMGTASIKNTEAELQTVPSKEDYLR